MSDVTRILDRVQQGEAQAAEELLPLVHEELRTLAARMKHDANDPLVPSPQEIAAQWLVQAR